jgi:hypothetical protein
MAILSGGVSDTNGCAARHQIACRRTLLIHKDDSLTYEQKIDIELLYVRLATGVWGHNCNPLPRMTDDRFGAE